MDSPIIRPFGESAVLLTWKQEISPEINEFVRNAETIIQTAFAPEIIETVITYAELAVYLKPETDQMAIIENLRKINGFASKNERTDAFLWSIPVCYALEFGIDLAEMAKDKNISPEEIIRMHTTTHFPVYFIGFLPGFLYLGGLPEALHHPRKATPRIKVPKGTIAIGGKQTGVYPMESPGGWNIIGKTPVQLFDVQYNPPVVIKPGDQVQFVSITIDEFKEIEAQVKVGAYEFSKTILL